MKRILVFLLLLLSITAFGVDTYRQPAPSIFYSTVTLPLLNTAGVVTNTSAGLLGTVSDVSTNTPGALVLRDGSGNFSANTITAALTGAASLNVLKAGDTMTGRLNDYLASDVVGLVVRGASAGTADLIQAQNNGGTVLWKVDSGGNVTGTSFNGPLTGNVTGNLTGNVTGNVSGTSANVTGTIAIGNGGTGQTSELAAINALTAWNTNSVIVGTNAATGTNNLRDVVIGYGAGTNMNTADNVFIGYQAGLKVTSGSGQDTFVGGSSGPQNTLLNSGSKNTGVGFGATGNLQTTAAQNSGLGYGALGNVSTGSNNTGVGSLAGATILAGSNNTLIGNAADVSTSSLTNATAIGASATVAASNSLVLGQTATQTQVGIGVTSPSAMLHVQPSSTATVALLLQGASLTTADYFDVKNNGGTVLAKIDSSGNLTANGATLANALSIGNGGTGQTSATAAFDALSPLTTTGDIIYYNGTHNARLAIGTTNQVLTVISGVPSWQTPSSSSANVTSSAAGTERIYRARLSFPTNTTCSFTSQSSTATCSASGGPGDVVITFPAGDFTAAPTCTALQYSGSGSTTYIVSAPTATTIEFGMKNGSGSFANPTELHVICLGPH